MMMMIEYMNAKNINIKIIIISIYRNQKNNNNFCLNIFLSLPIMQTETCVANVFNVILT